MGDFNLQNIDWDNWHSHGESADTNEYKFIECLQDNYLYQQVNKPTRFRGDDTPHTLDMIITNEENTVTDISYESPLGKSDHCVICFTYESYAVLSTRTPKRKMYDKADLDRINEEIMNIQWSEHFDKMSTSEEMWKFFHTKLLEIEDRYIPTKQSRNRRKKGT